LLTDENQILIFELNSIYLLLFNSFTTMNHKLLYLFAFVFFFQVAVSQEDTETGFSDSGKDNHVILPTDQQMKIFYDSLYHVHKKKLLVGYTLSIYNEIVTDKTIRYSFDDGPEHEISCDSLGRFYIIPKDKNVMRLKITCESDDFHPVDTAFSWKSVSDLPLICWLRPRYKIILRGRAIVGSLPMENVNVEITHLADTFSTQTQECYTDDGGYWNCLYHGMFKQEIIFDDPDDSVQIRLSREGLKPIKKSLICGNYDGKVLPLKMRYTDFLPELYQHQIGFRFTPPIFDTWMVSVFYHHLFNINGFNRLGADIEGGMFLRSLTEDLPRKPGNNDTVDVELIKADTVYVTGYISPNIVFWFTNPQNRKFSFYGGVSFPFIFPQKQFTVQPYLGSQFYLDLNKALFLEIKYLNYEHEIIKYTIDQNLVIEKYKQDESVSKIYFDVGIKISF
jgi:hypothetical protein